MKLRVGDTAAAAATGVFGPSQQCFNALNIVIIAVQNYQKIFDDLTLLIERLSVFLETLDVYLSDKYTDTVLDEHAETVSDKHTEIILDKRLRSQIYRVLEHFMWIMTLTNRLCRSGWTQRFKTGAKLLLFDDDSGVKDALATLETRVADVVRIQVAVIGQNLSEAAKDIRELKANMELMLENEDKILESVDVLNQRAETQQDNDNIRSWLHLHEQPLSESHHAKLNEDRVQGSGDWLIDRHEEFNDWYNGSSGSKPTILVTGGAGRGKTFLASAVIERLRTKVEGEPHAALAFYYVQDGAPDKTGLSTMYRALQSVIWQLTQKHRDYYNHVAKLCQNQTSTKDATRLWNKFISGYTPEQDRTFYLVVDGLGKSTGSNLELLIKEMSARELSFSSRLRLRLFITTSPEIATNIKASDQLLKIGLDPETIQGELVPNIDDVDQLISQRLAKSPIFDHDGSSAKKQQEQRVRDQLKEGIQNDFLRLDLVLRDLEHCYHERQLNVILARLKEDVSFKFAREIKVLNQKLKQDEIVELNAILMCMQGLANYSWLDLHVVEQFVDRTLDVKRISRLKQQVEKLYHYFFYLDSDGDLTWRYDDLKEYLLDHAKDERTIEKIDQKRGQESTEWDLEEVDLLERIVNTNLTNVLGPYGRTLLSKYGFADFFASKRPRAQRRAYITLDSGPSHVNALKVCLEVLCTGKDDEGVEHLRNLAGSRLPQLFENADPEDATDKQRVEIAKMTRSLVDDDDCIAMWSDDEEWSMSMRSILESNGPIRRWMNPTCELDKTFATDQQSEASVFEHTAYALTLLWMKRGREAGRNAFEVLKSQLDVESPTEEAPTAQTPEPVSSHVRLASLGVI
ncbi:hypothetical protein G6514_008364 [Epicoccum nigrum]|nr:hypothetical protein G6514_008364 [Epicoccum nigrum]